MKPNKTKWRNPKDWEFRENTNRKSLRHGSHPSLVVGDFQNKFANFGLSHSKYRGHHANIELSRNPNPKDKRKSYLRDDLQYDDRKYLTKLLTTYKSLSKSDKEKIMKIIDKKRDG